VAHTTIQQLESLKRGAYPHTMQKLFVGPSFGTIDELRRDDRMAVRERLGARSITLLGHHWQAVVHHYS